MKMGKRKRYISHNSGSLKFPRKLKIAAMHDIYFKL